MSGDYEHCDPVYVSNPVEIGNWPTSGISRRDYFAAMAMQIAKPPGLHPDSTGYASILARDAVEFADALIRELDKTNDND